MVFPGTTSKVLSVPKPVCTTISAVAVWQNIRAAMALLTWPSGVPETPVVIPALLPIFR